MTEIQNSKPYNRKAKRIEKDIFINTGKIEMI